jgi:Cu/Ag efflux protein CusF
MRRKKPLLIASMAVAIVAALLAYFALQKPAQQHAIRHALTGYVLEVTPEMNRITVRNAEVAGVMRSMAMDYHVKDAAVLSAIQPGDTIQAIMEIDPSGNWLMEDIKVTGKR